MRRVYNGSSTPAYAAAPQLEHMGSVRSVTDNGHDIENGDRWGHSGFLQFNDVSLDHLAPAEDRLELDLFDDGR